MVQTQILEIRTVNVDQWADSWQLKQITENGMKTKF